MPIAKGTAPSGEKFDFYVPRGTTAEEAPALARSAYFRRRQGIDVTQPPPPPESTIGGEFLRGAESLASAFRTTAGAAFGDDEAAALAALERSEDIAQKYGEGPSFQAVRDAEGILPTVGTALGQIPRAVAGQVPQLGATAAGAATGAALGSFVPGIGTAIGGGLGALASLIPQFAGYNIERQAETDIAEGRPVDIDTGKAVGTAALQAVPELIGQYFILGRGVVGKVIGKQLDEVGTAAKDAEKLVKAANEKLLPSLRKGERRVGAIGRGVATGAAAEMPTEMAQQVLERAQAGLDLLSPEAIAEYGEAAYLAATVGGTLGPIGSVTGRAAARREAERLKDTTFVEAPTEEATIDLAELAETPSDVDAEAIAQQEALFAEADRLRREAPQLDLPQALLPTGEPKTTYSAKDLAAFNIGASTKLGKTIAGLDLADPTQARTAVGAVVEYANNPRIKPENKKSAVALLNEPAFRPTFETVERETAQQEALEVAPEMEQIVRGVAPDQLTVGEGVEESIKREEQDIAFEQRAEQQRQAELKATLKAKQEAAQQAAVERAASLPEGTPTAMQAALQPELTRGVPVEGQAQLEMPGMEPRDQAAQEAIVGADLAQQIATEQRALERSESQPQEQVPMIGPRGGITPEAQGRGTRRQPAPQETTPPPPPPQPAAQETAVRDDNLRLPDEIEEAARDLQAKKADLERRIQAKAGGEAPLTNNALDENLEPDAMGDEQMAAREGEFASDENKIETRADTDISVDAWIQKTAKDFVDGKDGARADVDWAVANLSKDSKVKLNKVIDTLNNKGRKNLLAVSIASTTMALDPEIGQLLKDGKLTEGLDLLAATTTSKDVAKTAKAISAALIKDGNTKITFETNLMSPEGKLLAGTFDPKTNTIILNADMVPTTHVLLHEALHAVTSHEIANKSSPVTRQLQQLFDDVRDRLDTAYGATNLDEFIAEAFSNPEFQAKLASMDTKGNKLGVLERLKNIVENLIRRFRGLPFKKVESAKNAVDNLVGEMMSPAPQFRDAARLNMEVTAENERKILNETIGIYASGAVPKADISLYNKLIDQPDFVNQKNQWFLNILPLNSIADFIKDHQNPLMQDLGKQLDELFKVIQLKNGSRQKYLRKVKDTTKELNKVFEKLGPKQRALFNLIIMESTLKRVDPSANIDLVTGKSKGFTARQYYEGFRYSYVREDGSEFRSAPMSKEARDAEVKKLKDVDKNTKVAITNPSDGKLEDFDLVFAEWNKLDPEAQRAYVTLKNAYATAYSELRSTLLKRIDKVPGNSEQEKAIKKDFKDKILLDLLNKESIEPYFPLFRKGDFWVNHQGFDKLTKGVEQYKVAFTTRKQRDEYIQALRTDPQLRQDLLTSKESTIVEARERGRAEVVARANAEGRQPTAQEIQDAEFETALEPLVATRPTGAKTEATSVDIRWANKLYADILSRRYAAAEKAKQDALAEGKSQEEADAIVANVQAAGSAISTIVQDAMLNALPERALESSFRKRKDVYGAEIDAIEVFSERMPAFMGQVDNLKFDVPLNDRENAIELAKNKLVGSESYEFADQVSEQAKGYIKFAKNPQVGTWARRLKGFGFMYTLGLNLSSALVNSFILPIVVLPFLAGKYGYRNTMKALFDATKLYMGTGMRRKADTFEGIGEGETKFDGPNLTNLNTDNLPDEVTEKYPGLGQLVRALDDRGAANASTVGDMIDIDNPTGNKFDRIQTTVNAVSGFMFHQGERFNRQVTAIAAYKLAVDKKIADNKKAGRGDTLTDEERTEIINQVMLDIEHTNSGALIDTAPKIAQGDIGSVLLMYKRFGISMAYLQMKMARLAFRRSPLNKDEKSEAKKQIVGLFGMSGLLAGAQGLPLYGVATELANLFLLDDEDDDAETIVARQLGEGPYSGVLNAMFGLDIAPRIGMTNLIHRTLPNKETESFAELVLDLGGGPLGGIFSRMFGAKRLLEEGYADRAFESVAPSAISGFAKSFRYARDGGATTLRGDPITQDLSPLVLAGQLFGFAPAGYTKSLEISGVEKRKDRNINQRKTKLLRQRYMAYRVGDFEGVRDVDQEINEFNRRNPEVRITGDTKARSLRQHRITSEMARMLGGITVSQRRYEKVLRSRLELLGEDDYFL